MPNGILLVDKPDGMTSHGVVARVRKLAGTRKVGHAGTLDPMATGLLVLGLGASTRLLTWIVGADKEYRATIRLGSTTVTDDREGDVLETAEPAAITAVADAAILDGIAELTGDIEQVPSAVSAIKVDGVRSYAKVRAGEDVTLSARAVTISAFDVLDLRRAETWIDVDVRVECSSGTYIRALARDLGAGLGIGGHLTALRRTRIGAFAVTEAHTLDGLAAASDDTAASVESALLPPAAAAGRFLPTLPLTADEAVDLGHGKKVAPHPDGHPVGPLAAVAPDGRLVGIAHVDRGALRTLVNFPAEESS
ncbi:tRNA pseudouridine synthase B [Labedella gwakjiensis]|uniref:tRNA pseudouridine synthase B n=1 Tax=Labedella gwakjiensis TaxID=390269 RepID=A0A2P8GYF9_9MICO|nr:tRNA pseudouridine(55) synthase TruB [Labedella gwakjiensis]PSL38981.1 tRNA pseudouridine synthase B [Labedella gwakjiensis]RUQ86563.1 tRNA pseudouridine(55) synthase TruB [Labedella gwakjiensis]